MKEFMVLVLKIAFAQHLSNDMDNTVAKKLYESFFPNPKKRSAVSTHITAAGAGPHQTNNDSQHV